MAALCRLLTLVAGLTLCMGMAFPGFDGEHDREMQMMMRELQRQQYADSTADQPEDELYPVERPDGSTRFFPYDPEEDDMAKDIPRDYRMHLVSEWPEEPLAVGQVAGVATDAEGAPYIFHRGPNTFDAKSFLANNTYNQESGDVIAENTILQLDPETGAVVSGWGKDLFYLPHGLTVGPDGAFWVTDVALHQVFRLQPGATQPDLTLGRRFEPATSNDDEERFCKPTDVAVASTGHFYVADGYCNSRVLMYDKTGHVQGVFGVRDFWIPHSLELIEDRDLLCVGDREDRRVACYRAGLQNPELLGVKDVEVTDGLGRVYGVTYSPEDELLYAVTGRTDGHEGNGYTIDLNSVGNTDGDVEGHWSPHDAGFEAAHDVAVTPQGDSIYVGEIGPNRLWKFERSSGRV